MQVIQHRAQLHKKIRTLKFSSKKSDAEKVLCRFLRSQEKKINELGLLILMMI